MRSSRKTPSADLLEQGLDEVGRLMADTLSRSPLRALISDYRGLLANGKMLRARLAFRVGPAAGVPHRTLVRAAAAVELIHSASLLHDDVIDGGYLRRGAPAFWVERGIAGAILLGDLMLFKALDLLDEVEGGRLVPVIIKLTGEVCEAETEQELILRGKPSEWESCISIARRKTGALFAFMGHAAGGADPALRDALTEAGYAAGTAYQLADDILDANGDSKSAGKTLGRDEARRKATAARVTLPPNVDPAAHVEELCDSARRRLSDWPSVQQAWDAYMALDLHPALEKNLGCLARR